jgi:hypothetical protein
MDWLYLYFLTFDIVIKYFKQIFIQKYAAAKAIDS